MDIVSKGERAVVGDCVLMSCGDGERIMRVRDVDGCQIRLDGAAKSVEGIDRVRNTGTEECDFWAPLGESSF